MNTRFEANVASDVPKTRVSKEPSLPWNVRDEDLDKASATEGEYKATVTGVSPLKTRAVFIIMLLVTIFGAAAYYSSMVVVDKEEVRSVLATREKAVTSLRSELERASTQNETLNASVNEFEKRINELNSQKELFTAVIESLTKKSEAPATVEQPAPAVPSQGL